MQVLGVTSAVAMLCTMTIGAGTAAAADWEGSVEDPADRRGEADVAATTLRYDDTGELLLRVRFHEPVAADDPVTIDWIVTSEVDPAGCGDTRQGVAGLLEPRDGETTLTYSEVPEEDGVPATVEIAARQSMSADRRELTVTAESASLADRSFRCSQIALSNGDEVDRLVLAQVAGGRPATGPPEVKIEDGGRAPERRIGGLRVSHARLSFDRRGRRVVATLRALVCAPPGMRVVAEIRERRRRMGRRRFGPEHLHRYARTQRIRCQFHRWSWRFRADPSARHLVRANLVVSAETQR